MPSLSEDAQDVVFMRHVFEALMLSMIPPLYYWIGSVFAGVIVTAIIWAITRYTSLRRERVKAEIEAKQIDFQQYRFNCAVWFLWIKVAPLVVIAYVMASKGVWIYLGAVVAVCAFEIIWEWSKLGDLKDRLSKQST